MIQENYVPDYPKATICSLIAYLFMTIGMVCFKLLSGHYPFPQILMMECYSVLPLFLGLALFQGGLKSLKTHYPMRQFIRGLLQTASAMLSMWSLSQLPLSTATMLGYISPLIITLLAIPFLGEKCPLKNLVVILIGLAGVAFIAQPESGRIIAVAAQIISCFFWAGNALMMRRMDKDKVITFPFYTVITGGAIWSVVCAFGYYVPFTGKDLWIAIGAGVFFFVATQFLFSSYRYAPFHFTTPFQYLQLVWVVIFGYLIWAEVPTFIQLAGVAILIASSLWTLWHTNKNQPVEAPLAN